MGNLLQDIPTDFAVKVQVDDYDIYKVFGGIYLTIILYFLLKKVKK